MAVSFPLSVQLSFGAESMIPRTAVTYVVEYCIDEVCKKGEPQDQTSYNFSPMAEEGRSIQWRVEAFDVDGLGSGQTKPWSFSFVTAAPTQADETG